MANVLEKALFVVQNGFTLDTIVEPGTYRLTFGYPATVLNIPFIPPPSIDPFTKSLGGWTFDVSDWTVDYKAHTITFVLVATKPPTGVNEAGVPLSTVMATVATVFGFLLIYVTLDKVEKLIDTPAGSVLPWILLAVAAVFLFREFRKFKAA